MTKKINAAIILAAGFGTRLKPLTDKTPKALVTVGGIPMLKRTMDTLITFDFDKIFINTHYHSEQICRFVEQNQLKTNILYEPEILETGGTLKLIASNNPEIESLLVINCDSLFSNLKNVVHELMNMWDPTKMDGLFTLVPSNKNNTSADFEVNSETKLIYPVSDKSKAFTFTSPYIIKPKLLLDSDKNKFSVIKDFIYPKFNSLPNLYGYCTREDWIDIGTPKDLEKANKLFA